jgi:hypothetical protein
MNSVFAPLRRLLRARAVWTVLAAVLMLGNISSAATVPAVHNSAVHCSMDSRADALTPAQCCSSDCYCPAVGIALFYLPVVSADTARPQRNIAQFPDVPRLTGHGLHDLLRPPI